MYFLNSSFPNNVFNKKCIGTSLYKQRSAMHNLISSEICDNPYLSKIKSIDSYGNCGAGGLFGKFLSWIL